jgi:tetratricopeptide (TPR) repeat protein
MMTRAKVGTDNWLLMTVLIVMLGGGVLSSLYVVDKQRHALAGSAELSYLPKGDYLKVAVLGYRHIAADLLWLKAVQGLSGRQQTREGYLGAYHAADVLTDLDPQFVHAYQYTGTVLGVVAGLVKESVALLTKGVEHNPTVWQLSFFLGYEYYYELRDPASAARYFQAASLLPGAPPWLAGLAARMAVEANDSSAALEFLQRLYLQANDEQVREGLAQRIREVSAERDIRELEKAVGAYRERSGSLPKTLDDLVSAGLLARIPPEPFGGRYELSSTDGSVKSPGLRERVRVYRR